MLIKKPHKQISRNNQLGMVHDNLASFLKTRLQYICDISIKVAVENMRGQNNVPCAVYRDLDASAIDEYLLVYHGSGGLLTLRKSEQEMSAKWLHLGVQCMGCSEVLVSLGDEDKKMCSCENKTFVRGSEFRMKYGSAKQHPMVVKVHAKHSIVLPLDQKLLTKGK